MINKYGRILNKDSKEINFWPTFTDMFATILMIVILMFSSLDYIVTGVESDIKGSISATLEKLKKTNNIQVGIDENGSVTFGESTMFNLDSDALTKSSKKLLKEFIPSYVKDIYSNHEDKISKIVIEGHTDDKGSYLYNLDLSQRRAFNVAKYILSDEIGDYEYKDKLRQDLIAVGRSEAMLIKDKNGKIDRNRSRRVEIKYEIKN